MASARIWIRMRMKARLPTHARIDGQHAALRPGSIVLLEQLRTLDRSRLRGRIGRLSGEELEQFDHALKVSVGLADAYRGPTLE